MWYLGKELFLWNFDDHRLLPAKYWTGPSILEERDCYQLKMSTSEVPPNVRSKALRRSNYNSNCCSGYFEIIFQLFSRNFLNNSNFTKRVCVPYRVPYRVNTVLHVYGNIHRKSSLVYHWFIVFRSVTAY